MPHAQQLGRYHLLDRIAFGGMAEIFRAKTFDAVGNIHLVAIKRLLAHLIADDEFLQMLVDEAKISALLQHTNIARVYEFAHAGDEYFLAMEYIDGKDVRALLERSRQTGRPIPAEHAAWIAMEVATALHAAHTQRDKAGAALRIVHRDVSPSNVLCSYRGDVKLCDFGIAKATLTRVQTKTGVIKGKVKYMSPEQAMGRKLDHRSDIFSLGTVLYEMLTLQAPFQAPTEVELIFAVRDARKKSVRDHAHDCPIELQTIIDKAMTRSRTARYQSGEQMATELRQFLDAYKPGYRRSHFSRYMRKQFAGEIERELRILEGYTIEQAESGEVGENLIADALGPDAPFTRFTPMYHSPGGESKGAGGKHDAPPAPAPNLHNRRTLQLDGVQLGFRGLGPLPGLERNDEDFHEQETRLLGHQTGGLHEAQTRLLNLDDMNKKRLATGGKPGRAEDPQSEPTVDGFRRGLRSGEASGIDDMSDDALFDLDNDLLEEDGIADDFHDRSTRILSMPEAEMAARRLASSGKSRKPAPIKRIEPHEVTAVVRLKRGRKDGDVEEPPDLLLDDEDLEEI